MYLQLAVLTPPAWAETVATLLVDCGCSGTSEKLPLIDKGGRQEVIGYADALLGKKEDLLTAVREGLAHLVQVAADPDLTDLPLRVQELAEQPWEDVWKERWRPFRVAGFILRPPWQEGKTRPGDLEVVLDPGSAFGTGLHVTTRQALRGLRSWLDQWPLSLAEATICDAGTGSGILTIAALKAGVGRVEAFDIDERSVRTARRNMSDNGVASRCHLYCGGPAPLKGEYPLVLGNLETDPHLDNCRDLARLVAPGGSFIGCGIHRHRAEQVLVAYAANGLTGEVKSTRGKWTSIYLEKTGNTPAT